MAKPKKRKEEEWPDWDELELLPGIGYRRRSWIVECLKKTPLEKKLNAHSEGHREADRTA